MTVNIIFSSSLDYSSPLSVVQEPVELEMDSQVSPPSPVCDYAQFYMINVGDERALNCGFYIMPYTSDLAPGTSVDEFTTILSWSADGSEYGVYTIQGTDEVTDFLNPVGGNYLCEYSNALQQHTYTSGTTIANRIPLRDGNGTLSNELWPVSEPTAVKPVFYSLVKIPDGEPVAVLRYKLRFYYEVAI